MTDVPDRGLDPAFDPAGDPAGDVPPDDAPAPDYAPDGAMFDIPDEVALEETIAPVSDPVGTARRRHGTAGAVLAAGLFGIDVALGRKPKEEIPVVVASNDEPVDVDRDGIAVAIDDTTSMVSPPLPRLDPRASMRRRARPRRR